MKSQPIRSFFCGAIAAALCITAFPADATSQKVVKLPRSQVEKVDPASMTFTVKMLTTNLVVRFTPDTKFDVRGQPGTAKDLAGGSFVELTLRKTPQGPEAVRVHLDKSAAK